MALDSTHPQYAASLEDWTLMRDAYAGERVVKEKGVTYLPATPGQLLDKITKTTDLGWINYLAYKTRAVFHDYVSDAVESYIGLLHQKPAAFELPDGMSDMLENATIKGESLQTLLRRINEQQLVTGRLGLLLDLPTPSTIDPAKPMPYIAMYQAEAIRNWDDSDDKQGVNSLNFVSLDETSDERQPDFNWIRMEKYRILILGEPVKAVKEDPQEQDKAEKAAEAAPRVYSFGVFYARDSQSINPELMEVPSIRGNTLDEIPFVFINSKDIVATPDNPSLLGLGRLCMTIYRGEADYRHHLFMQGQDTLVVIGGIKAGSPGADDSSDDGVRVGAGARLDVDLGGDAKYIGVNSTGLTEVRVSLENDKKRAEAKAGQLATANQGDGGKESGEALNIRLAAQTATLMQIALSGAAGLENILKIAAKWLNLDPKKVKVTPNLEFVDVPVDGKTFVDLMSARSMGAPLSLESIHAVAVERGLTQFTFEEEMDKIDEEDAGRAKANEALGLDPNGAIIPPPEDPNALGAGAKGPASA